MDKIYWSKQSNPDEWPTEVKGIYFPFAEKLVRRWPRFGWAVIKLYLTLRGI